jgi:hypothetical protein
VTDRRSPIATGGQARLGDGPAWGALAPAKVEGAIEGEH